MATAYLDASDIASLDFSHEASPADFDYPTPAPSSEADGASVKDEPSKKKRKAWGQPVPEIVQILPPRKRAKTAEEKEQRKNERILRNRRAADKSRQRQKAQQANLEQQNKDLIAENAQLKEVLAKAGLLSDFTFVPPPPEEESSPTYDDSHSTPSPDDEKPQLHQPVLSQPTPPASLPDQSPSLAPQLDLDQSSEGTSPMFSTCLTQYPAVSTCLEQEAWTSVASSIGEHDLDSSTLPHYSNDLFTFNPLADHEPLPDFGTSLVDNLESTGNYCPEQFLVDPYFDFNAFDIDSASNLSYQTTQPPSGLQSQFSASLDDGRRPGFAAETR